MPELPEVEVVRRGLHVHVVGRTISSAQLLGSRVARGHPAGPVDLAARLTGAVVHAAERRGKYLWLVVQTPDDDPHALIIHLGMSGQLLMGDAGTPRQKHLRASVDFGDDGPQLRFVDQRTFGGMALAGLAPVAHRRRGVPETIVHIAPDPLEPAFDQGGLVRSLKSRHTAIKRLLLDQGKVSGIGNIYADEALWRVGVHGERPASALTKPAIGRVVDAAREVMLEALEQGGTSFDALYVNVNGTSGYFDRSLNVYGRSGRACPRCGAVIRRESFMNRSSFSCPRCQPRPRATA